MIIFLSAIFLFLLFLFYKFLTFKSRKLKIQQPYTINVDTDRAALNLSRAIQCKTISSKDPNSVNWDEFDKLKLHLKSNFPLTNSVLHLEEVNNHSLLYKWSGKDSSKKPILFLSHMDVVPVDEITLDQWTHEPFSGTINDGFVWGRGAIDMKVQLTCILESIESLLASDYIPSCDIYLAFGHDEEVGGYNGANELVKNLKSKGLLFEYILDEGGCITTDLLKNITSPIAAIGTCEKGFCTIRLSCYSKGGHASMPPKHTALGQLCEAIDKLENNQMPLNLSKPVKEMLSYIGPEMNLFNRFLISNLWLFKPLVLNKLANLPLGNSLLRTTTAATMAEASNRDNVLPSEASMTLNFRIMPGETCDNLINHINHVLSNNPEIKIDILRADNPSKVSPSKCTAFKTIEKTIYSIYPDVTVTPYLFVMGTDSRRYSDVSTNIYRFSPYMLSSKDLSGMHGINERVSLANIENMIKFYTLLIMNS